jgi:hypothetical protein
MVGAALLISGVHSEASARIVNVKVDAKTAPWDRRSNPKLGFGVGDGQMPKLVWGARLYDGIKVRFKASGSAGWITGGPKFGPRGDSAMIITRSLALLPSHYLGKSKPIGMIGLVGAFVSADGTVIGTPFAIGESAEVEVPVGAIAISLGVNDDVYADNDGTFTVTVDVPEPSVTVEAQPTP